MKWEELSITDLKSLYDHATMYTSNAELAKAKMNGLDTRSDKDKEWHRFWKEIQVSCAKRLLAISQSITN